MADDEVPGQAYRVNEPDVIHQLFDREVVVVDLRNGSYYSLSESGGTAWLAFGSGGASVEDVARRLTTLYALTHDVAARDLQAFIAELTTRDLIVACPPETLSADTATVATPTEAYSPPELRSYNDLQELFLLDPVHEVDAAAGWRQRTHRRPPASPVPPRQATFSPRRSGAKRSWSTATPESIPRSMPTAAPPSTATSKR